ncbi:MAG: phosphotransferase family protein [Akkermansiaceae bacterium]
MKKHSISYVPLMRDGHVLLALPLHPDLAQDTLNLYQPQKWKGRLTRSIYRGLSRAGIHRLLPKFTIIDGSKGLLSVLNEQLGVDSIGFLLGNPAGKNRNMIGVIGIKNQPYVVKAGYSESANGVRREHENMRRFSGRISCIPRVMTSCSFGDAPETGFAYVADMVEGDSPRHLKEHNEVLGLLHEWLDSGVKKRLGDLKPWSLMLSATEEAGIARDVVDGISSLEVVSPIVHGDFAPWNIKMKTGLPPRVIDWESAEECGVPGWDGMHYQIQRWQLVEGVADSDIYLRLTEWIKSNEMTDYWRKTGLDGIEDILLASYLIYSSCVQGFERKGLLKHWMADNKQTNG